jgi:alpha-tubulin suppressor-like RCC1 family protein
MGLNYLLANGVNANVGDTSGDMGSALTPIDFGTSHAVSLDVGLFHGCALLASRDVKCWGSNSFGQFGVNGNVQTTAELGSSWPAVDLGSGRTARAITVGNYHSCAIVDTGAVACWGKNDSGQLGYGDIINRGYAHLGSALTTVKLGSGRTATAITAGWYFTCAILDDGTVKCWGNNDSGQLGQNTTDVLGDNSSEMANLTAINLGEGRTAKSIYASRRADLDYTCAILDNDSLKCWSQNDSGQLGVGDSDNRGDATGEIALLPTVNLGTGQTASQVTLGEMYTCVILTSTDIKCFGKSNQGQLGDGLGYYSYGSSSSQMGDNLPIVNLVVVNQ